VSTTHAHVAGAEPHGAAEEGHNHPTASTYVRIGVVLAVLTLLEIWAYNIEQLGRFVAAVLIALAITKFVLVVGFYMHLRFDSRLFMYMFGFALLVAVSVFSAFLVLWGHVQLPPDTSQLFSR
jgi:cytochrome c oxidase subunit 4